MNAMKGAAVFMLLSAGMMYSSQASGGSIAMAYSFDQLSNISLKTGIANNFALNGTTSFASDDAFLLSAGKASFNAPLAPPFAAVGPNAGAVNNANQFTQLGPHLAEGAAVISRNLTSEMNSALVNLDKPDEGSSSGTVKLDADFTLNNADKLTISFVAQPILKVFLANGLVTPPSLALARLVVDIDIKQQFGNFDQVFSWRPDGGAGNAIAGGVENADPFSLNKELVQELPGQKQYAPGAAPPFSATTNQLAAGAYTIDIYASETAFAVAALPNAGAAPEPSSLTLLSLGSLGLLGHAWRRRKQVAPKRERSYRANLN